MCRFSHAGNHGAFHARMRPAFEKRQGTKSRREVVGRQCRKLYGVLVTGVSWRPDDLQGLSGSTGIQLKRYGTNIAKWGIHVCPIHDFTSYAGKTATGLRVMNCPITFG